jgi:hypothetical protein
VGQRLKEKDPSHIQSPNPGIIPDAKKCLLTGAWYSCLLRGFSRAWQIQRRMLTPQPTIGLSTGSPMEELKKGLEELKGFAAPQEKQQYQPTSTPPPQSSQRLNHLPKRTHRGTHGSSHICTRGWACWASMGGEILALVSV